MIRRLATPPTGWNGNYPPLPAGVVAINEVDEGGIKIAAYWQDDSASMTEQEWTNYVISANYSNVVNVVPTVEERIITLEVEVRGIKERAAAEASKTLTDAKSLARAISGAK